MEEQNKRRICSVKECAGDSVLTRKIFFLYVCLTFVKFDLMNMGDEFVWGNLIRIEMSDF